MTPCRIVAVVAPLVLLAGFSNADDKATPAASQLPPAPSGKVGFQRAIQPIFARACLSCHNAEKQRSGLRLDDGKAALKGGNSGTVITPGDALKSRLLHLIASPDPKTRMPPKNRPALTAKEVGLIRAWVEQGAVWPKDAGAGTNTPKSKHWAFQPPKRHAPPKVAGGGWARNPIDAFILARLEREKIQPSPEADRVTLIRRLSLDLLGLPPAPAEVDAFIQDKRPDAYERLVERLLASPHYGERWGRHWLDLARYAD